MDEVQAKFSALKAEVFKVGKKGKLDASSGIDQIASHLVLLVSTSQAKYMRPITLVLCCRNRPQYRVK